MYVDDYLKNDSPMSGMLEGFRAAAASLAIIGDIRPLLAEIFSMMEEVA